MDVNDPNGTWTQVKIKRKQTTSESSHISQKSYTERTTTKKIPPIIISQVIADVSDLIIRTKNQCKSQVTLKYNKFMSVYTTAITDHQKVIEELKLFDVAHYTFTLQENKSKHIVLTGLLHMDLTDLETELPANDIIPKRLIQMKRKATQEPTMHVVFPLYMITLNTQEDFNRICKRKTLHSLRVTWEKYRNTRKVTQCFRCQQFEHGMSTCANKPKCVKCAQQHLTTDCKLTITGQVKCANCNGTHTANNSNCPVYIAHLGKVQENKSSRNVRLTINPAFDTRRAHFPELLQTRVNNDQLQELLRYLNHPRHGYNTGAKHHSQQHQTLHQRQQTDEGQWRRCSRTGSTISTLEPWYLILILSQILVT